MTDIDDLIDRLANAAGPDRSIDAELDAAFRVGNPRMENWVRANFDTWRAVRPSRCGLVEVVHENGKGGLCWESHPFTGSMDAAVFLVRHVLPEWGWMSYWKNCQGHLARVEDNANMMKGSTGKDYEAIGRTAALALCSAALMAQVDRRAAA